MVKYWNMKKAQQKTLKQQRGEEFKLFRLATGLSQRDLAKLIDADQPYVSRLENGTFDLAEIHFKRAVAIAKAFGITVDALAKKFKI